MGRKNFWSNLAVNCKIERIQLMALLETKSEIEPVEKAWKSAGFDNMIYSPACGLSGGICILWKSYQLISESILVYQKEDRFICILYEDNNSKRRLFIIFVYAPPNQQQKQAFWDKLQNFISTLDLPFMIVGDLNEIEKSSEKGEVQ